MRLTWSVAMVHCVSAMPTWVKSEAAQWHGRLTSCLTVANDGVPQTFPGHLFTNATLPLTRRGLLGFARHPHIKHRQVKQAQKSADQQPANGGISQG